MARIARKPDGDSGRRRERRTQERIRKKEIEDIPSGGGASFAAVLAQAASSQTVPQFSADAINFGALVNDSTGGAMWAVGNPTRLVAPSDGHYFAWANWWFYSMHPNHWMEWAIQRNGDPDDRSRLDTGGSTISADVGWAVEISRHLFLDAGDYIELILYHEDTGGGGQLYYNGSGPVGAVDRGALFGMHKIG